LLAESFHGNAVTDDLRSARGFAELIVFKTKAAVFERMLRDEKDAIDGKRLFEKVVGAELGGFHGGFDGAVAGDHDDNGPIRLRDGLNAVERFESIDSGQPDVENYELKDGPGEEVEAGFAALDRFDMKTLIFEDPAE
jgi:hypothetical protein